jgi:acylphosphatase
MSQGEQRLVARVSGRVQGVGFRAFVQRHGRRLLLRGWVRNCEDGSVEAVAEGPESRLRELEAELRRGPSGATVERVELRREPVTGEFSGFNIHY